MLHKKETDRRILVTCFAFLVLCSLPVTCVVRVVADAKQAELPKYSVGDRWKAAVDFKPNPIEPYPIGMVGNMTLEVTGDSVEITQHGNSYLCYEDTLTAGGTLYESVTGTWSMNGKAYFQKSDLSDVKSTTTIDITFTYAGKIGTLKEIIETTYNPPLESGGFPLTVGKNWSATTTETTTIQTTIEGQIDQTTNTTTYTKNYSVLRTESTAVSARTFETFVIKVTNPDGSYGEIYYAPEVGMSVKELYSDSTGALTRSYELFEYTVVDITKPTANAGPDQTVNEDTLVTFDASASSDNMGITSYAWAFTDEGTLQTLDGTNPTYTFQTHGIYTVTLNVTDAAGNQATDTVTITVLDVAKPIADADSDRTVNEDTPITLDGSASSDNVAITAYTWTFTDITLKTLTGEKPTYTFNTPGVYTITLNVTGAAENWATDTLVITVLDITKPVASAGQNQTVNVGATVSFNASGSTDNVGIVSYYWDFGDGTTGTDKTTTHTYTKPETYTVTLTVKDAAGNTATHQITIRVLAIEPFTLWILGTVAATIVIATAMIAIFLGRRKQHVTKG